ncbi:MAG: hypothetical protein K2Y20_07100 [Sphingomonas sp.]|nr:hypothetical protein [Sphingomonas sp.]
MADMPPPRAEPSDDMSEILEPPMTVREFDLALSGYLTRTQRREAWRALCNAGLIVFRA